MRWWHELKYLIRKLDRHRAEQELEDEIRAHLEMEAQEMQEAGSSPAAARIAARRTFGSVAITKEDCRTMWGFRSIETLWQDLQYGSRMLLKHPTFTIVATLTLALGIGASTAIFSAVNPILFEPLPYPHPSQIMMISDHGSEDSPIPVTFGTYRELVERSRSFDAIAVTRPWQPTMTGPAEPERLEGQRVSASYFHVLGVSPALGRDFDSSDDRFKGPKVAILSDRLWQRRFGS